MAQDKQNVAVIGCGYWGKNLVRNMAELGALAAVADAHLPNAEAQAAQFGVPVKSIDEILADKTIEGVVIAAPAAQHAAIATQALNAGKHVLVEKPLALTVSDAETLKALGEKQNKVVMVGHLLQYHPAYIKLKQLVDAGELGELTYVYSNRLSLGKLRTEENVLWSFAPHDISMILGLMGSAPTKVTATAATQVSKGIPDVCTASMEFAGGAKAHVFVSWLHPVKEQKLVVIGSKAMAVFDDTLPLATKLTLYRHGIAWNGSIPTPIKADGEAVALDAGEPLKNECQHYLDAMAGTTLTRTDAAEAIRVLSVLEQAEVAMGEASAKNYYLHPTSVVDQGCTIGDGTKIWHFSHILGGTTIGANCVISQNVMIGPDVVVGDRCKIQNNVSLYKGVTLEDGVFCGPSCVFTNVNTPRAEVERKDEYLPTRVGRAATIGANATIVCGNELGDYCLIGAGAVITKPVKPHALMVGNPATQLGWVSHAGERLGDDFTCPREGRRYRLTNDDQLEEITEQKKTA